jgi:hypothetical protein
MAEVSERTQSLIDMPPLPWTRGLKCEYPECERISIPGYVKCEKHFRLYKQTIIPKYTNLLPEGYVYVLEESLTGYYKIGSSYNPVSRAQPLQIGTPLPYAELLSYYTSDRLKAERCLQAFYLEYNVRSEWYDLSHVENLDEQCRTVLEPFLLGGN